MVELARKQWYIVTTYSMHEKKVQKNLEQVKKSMNLEEFIFDILVPEVQVEVPVKKDGVPTGEKKIKSKVLYPGYIYVEMIMTDEVWYVVRNTLGVTGIAGSSGGGQKPTPISTEEMEPILKRMNKVSESMYDRYKTGDNIKVIKGHLEGTEGVVLSIDKDTGVCKVETMFFGRTTSVEVDFAEIEKI